MTKYQISRKMRINIIRYIAKVSRLRKIEAKSLGKFALPIYIALIFSLIINDIVTSMSHLDMTVGQFYEYFIVNTTGALSVLNIIIILTPYFVIIAGILILYLYGSTLHLLSLKNIIHDSVSYSAISIVLIVIHIACIGLVYNIIQAIYSDYSFFALFLLIFFTPTPLVLLNILHKYNKTKTDWASYYGIVIAPVMLVILFTGTTPEDAYLIGLTSLITYGFWNMSDQLIFTLTRNLTPKQKKRRSEFFSSILLPALIGFFILLLGVFTTFDSRSNKMQFMGYWLNSIYRITFSDEITLNVRHAPNNKIQISQPEGYYIAINGKQSLINVTFDINSAHLFAELCNSGIHSSITLLLTNTIKTKSLLDASIYHYTCHQNSEETASNTDQ